MNEPTIQFVDPTFFFASAIYPTMLHGDLHASSVHSAHLEHWLERFGSYSWFSVMLEYGE